MSNLKPGRIRYGVICSEAGRIVDDGTVARLTPRRFTSRPPRPAQRRPSPSSPGGWKRGAWTRRSRTSPRASRRNVCAGPEARDLVSGLTDLDCSNDAFRYLDAQHADVAGVPCLLLRIGFVGEVGATEIHPVRPARLTSGLGHSIRRPEPDAFGLNPTHSPPPEAARARRAGTPTPSPTPYGAGMSWIIGTRQGAGLHRPLGPRSRCSSDSPKRPWSAFESTVEQDSRSEGSVVSGCAMASAGQVTAPSLTSAWRCDGPAQPGYRQAALATNDAVITGSRTPPAPRRRDRYQPSVLRPDGELLRA